VFARSEWSMKQAASDDEALEAEASEAEVPVVVGRRRSRYFMLLPSSAVVMAGHVLLRLEVNGVTALLLLAVAVSFVGWTIGRLGVGLTVSEALAVWSLQGGGEPRASLALLSVALLLSGVGELTASLRSSRDLRRQQQREFEAKSSSTAAMIRHDLLTGALNAEALRERLSEEALRATRYGHSLSLVYLDLDGFDSLSKTLDERMTRALIAALAETLEEESRITDIVGRVGTDEFVVILAETGHGDAALVAERIHRSVMELAREHSLGVSCGVASWPHPSHPDASLTGEGLLEAAEAAMLTAKRRGGARVVVSAV